MKNLAQHVLLLVAVSGGVALAQEAPLPRICQEVAEEARTAVVGWQGDARPDAITNWAIATAPRIASRHDRSAIASLIHFGAGMYRGSLRGVFGKLSPEQASQLRERELFAGAAFSLSTAVCIEVGDPEDQYGFKSAQREFGGRWIHTFDPSAVVAVVDVWHDEWAREVLEACLLNEIRRHSSDPLRFGPTNHFSTAAGFLRAYEPREVRPKIERALKLLASLTRERSSGPQRVLPAMARVLRANLAWLVYVESLETREDRQRYTNFQRRFWRAFAVAPRGAHLPYSFERCLASLVKEDWHSGDGQFVVQILREPESGDEERTAAVYLADQLTADEAEQLRSVAESGSPESVLAAQALHHWERARKGN